MTATSAPPSARSSSPMPPRPPRAVPAYAHVVLVIFENHEQSQIIGSPDAPYLTALASQGANFTHSFAIEHPSEPNYLDLFSGSNVGVRDDSCPHLFSANNIGHQLIATGRTFKGYSEDLPSVGSPVCSSGNYARKHTPWTNFSDLNQRVVTQPYSAFPTDFRKLPTLSWVVPNLCDDMHDCSVATGDAWARRHLGDYARWAKAHNSLLIVTFDEDDSAGNDQIATIFYGAHLRVGRYAERIDHFRVLRTLEAIFGVYALGFAARRAPITDVFVR
ncbi:MAG: alkaline phosphatase family protein [Marmoricola sp.]